MDMGVILLALALIAMLAGPAVFKTASRWAAVDKFIDTLVVVSILGLLFIHVLPEAVGELGWVSLPCLALGWWLPRLLEGTKRLDAKKTHALLYSTAFLGLIGHAGFDGLALAGTHDPEHASTALGVAVVLHRLPVGLAVWVLIKPAFGGRVAMTVLGLVCLSTVLGFTVGEELFANINPAGMAAFQLFVAGSLFHVVLHRTDAQKARTVSSRVGDLAGAAAAIALVSVVTLIETHHHAAVNGHALQRFGSLALSVAPALLLGYIMAGLVGTALPARATNWLGRGGTFS
ncbi:MAG: hypothetical protein KC561_05965 [Myxococcales bacterium]|nr:hypothetical protein [Myxococcales bacterium]